MGDTGLATPGNVLPQLATQPQWAITISNRYPSAVRQNEGLRWGGWRMAGSEVDKLLRAATNELEACAELES